MSYMVDTPWGKPTFREVYGPGVTFYGTASHGGFFLDAEQNVKIPRHMKEATTGRNGMAGWYEEDCDWCFVATILAEYFNSQQLILADKTLKNWRPDCYETYHRVQLRDGESYIKDLRRQNARVR